MKKLYIILIFLVVIFQTNAQTNNKELKQNIKKATKEVLTNSKNIKAYIFRARNYYNLEEFDNAIKDIEKVLTLDSENVDAMMLFADIYSKKRDYKKANYFYEEAVENGRKLDKKMKAVLGTNYYFIQDYENAIKYLTMSLEDDGNYSKIDGLHNNLAWSHVFTDDFKMAIVHFKTAYLLNPNYVNNVNNLGYAYYLDNQLNIAEEYILKAKKMDATNSFVYRNLGLIYKKRGIKKKSCKNYNKALSLNIVEKWGSSYIEELKIYCNE